MNTIEYEKEFSWKKEIKCTEISNVSQGFNLLFFSVLISFLLMFWDMFSHQAVKLHDLPRAFGC
jgi:hypothetical protein